jgi:hypothetical protein
MISFLNSENLTAFKYLPMLVIVANRHRDVRIGEDRKRPVRLRSDSRALYILSVSKPDVDRWVSHCFQQLRTRMLIQHSIAECVEFLPFESSVLE